MQRHVPHLGGVCGGGGVRVQQRLDHVQGLRVRHRDVQGHVAAVVLQGRALLVRLDQLLDDVQRRAVLQRGVQRVHVLAVLGERRSGVDGQQRLDHARLALRVQRLVQRQVPLLVGLLGARGVRLEQLLDDGDGRRGAHGQVHGQRPVGLARLGRAQRVGGQQRLDHGQRLGAGAAHAVELDAPRQGRVPLHALLHDGRRTQRHQPPDHLGRMALVVHASHGLVQQRALGVLVAVRQGLGWGGSQ
mmetsp:Transcript_7875/g.20026  ORF Transcript_7875/g.20026 Transcript_7875/m.20026 type:complete len:245 (-) Transcript_7875:27-761(-)